MTEPSDPKKKQNEGTAVCVYTSRVWTMGCFGMSPVQIRTWAIVSRVRGGLYCMVLAQVA